MPAKTLYTASGQPLIGPLLITPQVFSDDRGFYESWNERRFRSDLMAAGMAAAEAEAIKFRQDNHSTSCRGVLEAFIFSSHRNPRGNWCVAVLARSLMWRWIYGATRPATASGWGPS